MVQLLKMVRRLAALHVIMATISLEMAVYRMIVQMARQHAQIAERLVKNRLAAAVSGPMRRLVEAAIRVTVLERIVAFV
jgi:predicted DNA-binding ribbon-helix-helix protein